MAETDDDIQKTPLHAVHVSLGARMVPFSGWEMPVQYESIKDEHDAVRTRAGLFDVSHMGEFVFLGPEARRLLQYLTTNDLDTLPVQACHYTFFLNASGGTVDDAMVYRRDEEDFLVVVNAGNVEKDWEHVTAVARDFPEADIRNESDRHGLIALQGPESLAVARPLLDQDLSKLPFHTLARDRIAGCDVTIATSGYTGENGLEVFASPADLEAVWQALLADERVSPCGLGARDTLRLEASLALYGHELDDQTSPIEARLGFAVSKSGDYLGAEAIRKQRAEGVKKTLICLEMTERAIPRQGYPVLASGEEIGVVTSGSMAPYLDKSIAMAYVDPAHSTIGTQLAIRIRNRTAGARVVKRPFYTRPQRN